MQSHHGSAGQECEVERGSRGVAKGTVSPGTFAEEQGLLWAFPFVWGYEVSIGTTKIIAFLKPRLATPFLFAIFFFEVVTSSA